MGVLDVQEAGLVYHWNDVAQLEDGAQLLFVTKTLVQCEDCQLQQISAVQLAKPCIQDRQLLVMLTDRAGGQRMLPVPLPFFNQEKDRVELLYGHCGQWGQVLLLETVVQLSGQQMPNRRQMVPWEQQLMLDMLLELPQEMPRCHRLVKVLVRTTIENQTDGAEAMLQGKHHICLLYENPQLFGEQLLLWQTEQSFAMPLAGLTARVVELQHVQLTAQMLSESRIHLTGAGVLWIEQTEGQPAMQLPADCEIPSEWCQKNRTMQENTACASGPTVPRRISQRTSLEKYRRSLNALMQRPIVMRRISPRHRPDSGTDKQE